MKILWLCNIVLPELASEFGFKKINVGGWLSGAWNELKKQDQCELAVCVPVRNPLKSRDGTFDGYKFYSFLTISKESNTSIGDQIVRFTDIVSDFRPDIIHIWGTEYEHTYSMTKACENLGILSRIVVNIQGLLTYCEKVYTIGIPQNVIERAVDGKTILDDKNDFTRRAGYEQETLRLVRHVVGRTDWDRACVSEIGGRINYHHCGEILRDKFYSATKWNYGDCKKYCIFISQASYPIKGLHLILTSIRELKDRYNELEVRIGGLNLYNSNSAYSRFICKQVDELQLRSTIVFLGELKEEQMISEYQRANVFLSSSVIENSSNSICEAMMLGVPVVASFVGGTGTIVEHRRNGCLYPLNEPNMMSGYICEIFDSEEFAKYLSVEEIRKANIINNRETISKDYLSIYDEILKLGEGR